MLKIIRAGMYTTWRMAVVTVFASRVSATAATCTCPRYALLTLLVGNDANAPALEITLGQLTVELENDGWFALRVPVAQARPG
ncbi:hypothetical protein ACLK1S_04380 [Escherichia coli]